MLTIETPVGPLFRPWLILTLTCSKIDMEILGVTFSKVGPVFWIQLRNCPKYWYSLTYEPGYVYGYTPWKLKCYWGWTWRDKHWCTGRYICIGPIELSRDEK